MTGRTGTAASGNKVMAVNPSYEWSADVRTLNVSHRELEVFALLMDGHSNQEIADILGIQNRTVTNHISSLYKKLKAKNMAQAMKLLLFGNFIKVETFFYNKFNIQEWIEQTKWCIGETPVGEEEKRNLKKFLIEHGLYEELHQDEARGLKNRKNNKP
jgi:DNA-binding CsgD family transcriptional regulator